VIGEHRSLAHNKKVSLLDRQSGGIEPQQTVLRAELNLRIPDQVKIMKQVIEQLPEEPNDLPPEFIEQLKNRQTDFGIELYKEQQLPEIKYAVSPRAPGGTEEDSLRTSWATTVTRPPA
jgi:hypothetical protein